ncbi:MAG: DsbC family protein [Burkholderiaceae bacterium]|nr:DsbC family protein [Burkholderiaceae bacterium]
MTLSTLRRLALLSLSALALYSQAPAAMAQGSIRPAVGPALTFAQLPLSDAIVTVRGKGSRQLAIFSDPNCPYCKRLERELEQLQDVTLYTFLIPVLGPDSEVKSRHIWCAAKPQATWRQWMLDGTVPPTAGCDAQPTLQRNLNLARRLGVQGTPTMMTRHNELLVGVVPTAQLTAKL